MSTIKSSIAKGRYKVSISNGSDEVINLIVKLRSEAEKGLKTFFGVKKKYKSLEIFARITTTQKKIGTML